MNSNTLYELYELTNCERACGLASDLVYELSL